MLHHGNLPETSRPGNLPTEVAQGGEHRGREPGFVPCSACLDAAPSGVHRHSDASSACRTSWTSRSSKHASLASPPCWQDTCRAAYRVASASRLSTYRVHGDASV